MKKILILFCVLMTGFGAYAQSAVSASGGESSGSGGSASYTVGQTFYSANEGTSGQVSEGVQQVYEIYDVTEVLNPVYIGISLSVYPNPTTGIINLLVENGEVSGLNYAMFDATGKQVLARQIVSNNNSIDMQSLPSATYYVRVTKDEKEVKTFKVIKN